MPNNNNNRFVTGKSLLILQLDANKLKNYAHEFRFCSKSKAY